MNKDSRTVSPSSTPRATRAVSRRATRCALIKALYQWHWVDAPLGELLEDGVTDPQVDPAYFQSVLQGIVDQKDVIDAHLSPLVAREWDAITPIEISVLRLATYELMSQLDIPFKVVINEALELNKLFGTPEGYRFINAVLDKLAAKLR